MNALDKAVERAAQGSELILGFHYQAARQVAFAFGDVLHGTGHHVQRLHQQANQQAEQGDDRNHGNNGGNDCRRTKLTERSESLFLVDRQADMPIDRAQPLDRGEADDPGFAIDLDLAERSGDCGSILRIDIPQVFGNQAFIRVHQDFTVGVDQEGVAHTVEIQRIDAVGNGLQGHVGADNAQGLPSLFHRGPDGNHHLSGGRVYIRFGQA